MRINKINNNLIEIILSEEELCFDYDIYIDDILDPEKRQDISKTLVKIVQDISQKENIEVKNGMQLDVAFNKLNEMILTVKFIPEFSPNNLYGIAKYVKAAIYGKEKEEASNIMQEIFAKLQLNESQVDKVLDEMNCIEYDLVELSQEITSDKYLNYILKTNSLDNCINFSKIIKDSIKTSKLYKLKDEYYLELEIKENSDNFILMMSSEFLFKNLYNMIPAYLEEHAQLIIKENAVLTLSNI